MDVRLDTSPLDLLKLTFPVSHRPGSILRITRPAAHSGSKDGPQLPPGAAGDDQWHVQGTLLEVRDEQLIVAFEEGDMWSMGDDEAYQCVHRLLSVVLSESG